MSMPVKKVPLHINSAASRLLIKGGKCINDDRMFDADIYVEGGVIKEIGQNLIIPGGTKVIEAKGKLVMPGGIDTSTHMQLPVANTQSVDDFYHGTKAAIAGGTTMIIDHVQGGCGVLPVEAYDKWRSWADGKVCCDYGLHVEIPQWNEDIAKDMETLVNEKGVNSFKVSQSGKGETMLDDGEILEVFNKSKSLGALAMVHSENGHIVEQKSQEMIDLGITGPEGHAMCRPEEVEGEATYRAIVLANQARCPLYVLTVTSKTASNVISEAKRKGRLVFGEPVAASLGTDGTNYWNSDWRHAAAFVMEPPLRADPSTPGHLMDLLANGDLEVTGTSNCTFNSNQKALGKDDFRKIPNGVNGVEDRMSVVWEKGVHNGKMDACRFVAVTSTNAAKIFNIYPKKGHIGVGSDADLVIWDPEATRVISAKTHNHASDFNIFEGMEAHGVPLAVVCRGRVAKDEEGLHLMQGSGRYVPTPPNSPYVFGRVSARDQALAPQKVDREPYDGAVVELVTKVEEVKVTEAVPAVPDKSQNDGILHRPPTRSGGRHMQESSFAFSGDQFDDRQQRNSSRVSNPPGGQSQGLW